MVPLLYSQERESDGANYRDAREAIAAQEPELFVAVRAPICY
jgi:hypothetical protein